MKGLNVDLVILNVDESNYLQPLRTAITNLVERSNGRFLRKPEVYLSLMLQIFLKKTKHCCFHIYTYF